MDNTKSPNMSLLIPTVGSDPGPTYAQDVNASLGIIDSHNHTPGSGVQITPAAININADLTFGGYRATNLAAVVLSTQSASPTSTGSIYAKLGSEALPLNDLWYFDGTNQVQLTAGGLVNATIASIPGESYNAGVFTWRQGAGSTVPANFDIGSIVIRPNTAGTSFGTTILPSPSLASSFGLLLPTALPGTTLFMTLDASGNIGYATNISPSQIVAGSITGSQIASATITTSNIAPATILGSNIAASTIAGANILSRTITTTNIAVPAVSVSAGTSTTVVGTTPVSVLGVPITTVGNPVLITLQGNSPSAVTALRAQGLCYIAIYRGGTVICTTAIGPNSTATGSITSFPAALSFIDDSVSAGAYTYFMYAYVDAAFSISGNLAITNLVMKAIELK